MVLQNTTISQLMEQASIIKMENKQILEQFNSLALQMEAFMKSNSNQTSWHHARGHASESSKQTWCAGAAANGVMPTHPCVACYQWNHPFKVILNPLWMKVLAAQATKVHGATFWVKNHHWQYVFYFRTLMDYPNWMMERSNYTCYNNFISQHQIDIVGLVETNTCWDLLNYEHRLLHKMQGWWETAHWSLSFNQMDTFREIYQLGGTAIITINVISHSPGSLIWQWSDRHGMLVLDMTEGNHFTHIVSMYCPCDDHRPSTTYEQQVHGLAHQGWAVCPQKAILDNIAAAIQTWKDGRDKVLLLTDFNDDIWDPDTIQFFNVLGIHAIHLAAHRLQAPHMYQWGRLPIDGI